jgi:anaerobic dimethyl sulfoxide reductase subunit B (iron-sulfur subunit)
MPGGGGGGMKGPSPIELRSRAETGPGFPGTGTMTSRSGAGFLLDLARCVGCGACALACRLENRLSPDLSWRRILPLNLARSPAGPTYHFSLACHHCEAPPCAKACPSGALEKRSDGVVLLHADRCIGCRYCEMACPFGAPAYDAAAGVMTKCHLCSPRLDRGLEPACVTACPTDALRFSERVDQVPPPFGPAAELPGFADPSGARPSLRLAPPKGEQRERALEALERVLDGEGGRSRG